VDGHRVVAAGLGSTGSRHALTGLQQRHNLLARGARHHTTRVQLGNVADQPDVDAGQIIDALDHQVDAVNADVQHRDDAVDGGLQTTDQTVPKVLAEFFDASEYGLDLVGHPVPRVDNLFL